MISAVVSMRCFRKMESRLKYYFDSIYALPPDDLLAPEVSDHPDMIISVLGSSLVVPQTYYLANRELINTIAKSGGFGIILSGAQRSAEYPHDIGVNALITERHIIGKLKFVAPELLETASDAGLRLLGANQGYAACSSVSVGNVVVTGDISIMNAAKASGYDVIKVDPSKIVLDGYGNGFIGGAAGVLDNTVFFTGDPRKTPGTEALVSDLEKREIKSVILADSPLTDYGGIKLFKS